MTHKHAPHSESIPTLAAEARVGVGLRTRHYADVLASGAPTSFLEAISENVLGRGGRPRAVLEKARRDSDIALHGVSMSIGGLDPISRELVNALKDAANELEVLFVSDHLCFESYGGMHSHDLWPLPLTTESLRHVAARVDEVQEILKRPLVIENPSTYVRWAGDTYSEPEFLGDLVKMTGCLLLVDINNLVVNAHNHRTAVSEWFERIDSQSVAYLHLAGHARSHTGLLLDTHEGLVDDKTLAVYRSALSHWRAPQAILEWDGEVPALADLLTEVERIKRAATTVGPRIERTRSDRSTSLQDMGGE